MTASCWAALYAELAERLGSSREARWMLEEVAGRSGPDGGAVPLDAGVRLEEMLRRRLSGEPLQYVLGRWAFRDLDLAVDPRVLIPRPETEQVVEVALAELDRQGGEDVGGADPGPSGGTWTGPVVVDLGTGSGAIALSLATERPELQVWATDVSPAALEVARSNASTLGGRAGAVRFLLGSWWEALPPELAGRVRVVVANPPYVSTEEMVGLDPVVVEWEPRRALEAGPSGLEDLLVILGGAPSWLAPGGAAVTEIAPHQASEVVAAARAAGFVEVDVHPDLAGRDRAVVARLEAA